MTQASPPMLPSVNMDAIRTMRFALSQQITACPIISRGSARSCSGDNSRWEPFESDLKGRKEPYSAIAAAFSDICDLILQNDNPMNKGRAALVALGPENMILSRVVSNIANITGEECDNEGYTVGANTLLDSCLLASISRLQRRNTPF